MPDIQEYKEVYFDQYCQTCEHWSKEDTEAPCRHCLDEPINLYSHKPVKWEEKTTKRKTTESETV